VFSFLVCPHSHHSCTMVTHSYVNVLLGSDRTEKERLMTRSAFGVHLRCLRELVRLCLCQPLKDLAYTDFDRIVHIYIFHGSIETKETQNSNRVRLRVDGASARFSFLHNYYSKPTIIVLVFVPFTVHNFHIDNFSLKEGRFRSSMPNLTSSTSSVRCQKSGVQMYDDVVARKQMVLFAI
jgi:hypothetical protein